MAKPIYWTHIYECVSYGADPNKTAFMYISFLSCTFQSILLHKSNKSFYKLVVLITWREHLTQQ